MEKLSEIVNLIKNAKNIALFTHIKPDPDAIGSVWSMYFALKQIKKNVNVFMEETISDFGVLQYENIQHEFDKNKFDLVIALDVANSILLGKYEKDFLNFSNSICIDHHLARQKIGNVEFVANDAASTTEILFDLFNKLEINIDIDKKIVNCIYLGIVGDTGRFMYNNTTSKTFKIAHILTEKGADVHKINLSLSKKLTKNMLKNLRILYNNIDIKDDILFSTIRLKDYKKYKCKSVSTNELIGFLTNVDKINIVIVLIEKEKNIINASLRSSEFFDASFIAKAFGGGGHKLAAGIQNLTGSVKQVKDKIYYFIKENINNIKLVK
ncbi:MAG: bifunctional oligoribonuclease/PAP phosphatase NrnA [Clostridia bacterium]|jgi:phosphoesterase RecJ-like protein|nr:bifunctional oligoribonuclease/PAP phosphatase NrnA [Clostridia bacterium]MDD3862415.1 bifunctional oligoribonuclease/PAP phosphatase NrnA [Clostridia bacterium]MDD4408321.1 bifunctional oligoribonuclease/PAP phosphatase NrnA [Clostridia bacterium]